MTTRERFFGLDGEMSGADLADGYRLIQIGVAVDTAPDGTRLEAPDLFCSLIGWAEDDLPWDDRAAAVHSIPREQVLAAPPAADVDRALHQWLTDHGADADARRLQVACGFNVGAFDMPFVHATLPRSAALFSRRYADLNPLCFALGSSAGALLGGDPSTSAWKRRLTRAGLDVVTGLGRVEGEHDAGTDALIALGAWREAEQTLARIDHDAARARRAAREQRKQATAATR